MEQQILTVLEHSYSPDAGQRNQAEAHILEFQKQPGFFVLVLKLVCSNIDVPIRQAGSIVLKNGLQNSKVWNSLSEEDSKIIKENIVQAIITTPELVRSQIIEVMKSIVKFDFPEKWPQLIPNVMQWLTSNDKNFLYGALITLRICLRLYGFVYDTEARKPLNEMVETAFPILIQIFTGLQSNGEDTLENGELQILMCKIFYSSAQLYIPPYLANNDNLLPWMQGLLNILIKPVTGDENLEEAERTRFVWWKGKKWCAYIFTSIFSRFSSTQPSSEQMGETDRFFGELFKKHYCINILQAFLLQLDSLRSGKWLPNKFQAFSLDYVATCVRHSATYKVLKPNIDGIFREILFPVLCFSKEDQDLWEDNPGEFLKQDLESMEEWSSLGPRQAAVNLLIDVIKLRGKDHLGRFMTFIVEILNKYSALPIEQRNFTEKDGALRIIGALNRPLKKIAPYNTQIEAMLFAHVFSEFENPNGFLRAKACWVLSQFWDIEIQNQEGYANGILALVKLLNDPELPVRGRATIALQYVFAQDIAVQVVKPHLPEMLQQILKIMGEVDNDDLVVALHVVIERFGDEVAPFAYQIITSLAESIRRNVAANVEEETASTTTVECLSAINTILESSGSIKELYAQVEPYLVPIIASLLNPEGIEYLDEVLTMLSYLTYFPDTVSPAVWELFPVIFKALEDGALDYIGNLVAPLDNYISNSTETFLSQPIYLELVMKLFTRLLGDPEMSELDCGEACKLIEVVLHNCPRGSVDHIISDVLVVTVTRLSVAEKNILKILALEVVANSLFYSPNLTLNVMAQKGWLNNWNESVFVPWFAMIDKFTRTHDKKVSILGLSSILCIRPISSIPGQFQLNACVEIIIQLLVQLGEQRITEEQAKKEEEEDSEDYDDISIDDVGDDQDVNQIEDEFSVTTELTSALKQYYSGGFNALAVSDDELEDEENFITPIDNINELIYFVTNMKDLSEKEPQIYEQLINSLQPQTVQLYQALCQKSLQEAQEQQTN